MVTKRKVEQFAKHLTRVYKFASEMFGPDGDVLGDIELVVSLVNVRLFAEETKWRIAFDERALCYYVIDRELP